MKYTQSLPEPSPDALAHSHNLIGVIRQEIDANGGSITFRRYMEMALYQPALGYYVAGTHKIGEQGDFITAPEVSPLFSRCIANQCAEVINYTRKKCKKWGGCTSLQRCSVQAKSSAQVLLSTPPSTDILELGAGTGKMAAEILLTLEKQQQLPDKYFILDLSPDLKQRQHETINKLAPHLLDYVEWLSQLPKEFVGIIIGNEVLDAMPVDIFTQHFTDQGDNIYEHHVIWEDGKLVEQLKPAKTELKKAVKQLKIPEEATPYTSEINSNIEAWLRTLSDSLVQGVILLADYGYPRKEYYLDERKKGTLICHYQHRVNEAPLYYPGLQDITASVDFTAVAEAADKCNLNVTGFTSQATFLANAGLESYFMEALDKNPDSQYRLAQQIRTLSLPAEMGERFKFIALSKDYDESLIGFTSYDLRYRL